LKVDEEQLLSSHATGAVSFRGELKPWVRRNLASSRGRPGDVCEQAEGGGVHLRLGTKLTLYLSLIIILTLFGYGYVDTLSRRDVLIRKMKAEVRSTGRTLGVSLEETSLPGGRAHIQRIIDAVAEYERTVGVVAYYSRGDALLRSDSLEKDSLQPYVDVIKKAIQEDAPQEIFTSYKKLPIFLYAFALKDGHGRTFGGLCILQNISFMEEEIAGAKWNILLGVLVLVAATMALVLFATRKWITRPISILMAGIDDLARGNLDPRIALSGRDEFSRLARAFNEMAVELKKAQERIIQEGETKLELERSLRQSSKLAAIGQLASGLAHEIGTPLNIIGGRAELIKRRVRDKSDQKDTEIILQQAERISRIIQQLLGFVRKKRQERRELQMSTVIEGILDLLQHEILKQEVIVVKQWGNDRFPVIGDPDQLQQAFLNLMLNALQSMPRGGTLRLSLESKAISRGGLEEERRKVVEIDVEDTGTGMEKEVLEHVFTPFYTTKEKGTGLGLMVTQGIIQDHEGWIDVESEVGKGSMFRVFLPVCEGH
jgi:two-component system NtrC family sensor kinase